MPLNYLSKILSYLSKIKTDDSLESWIKEQRKASKKIVFTNGVFDILHRGHVYYLNLAATLGDVMILGLNSDSSTKQLNKGDDRPINSEDTRAEIIAGLGCIDAVMIFNEKTPYKLIQKITPDVLVKGGDYDPNITNENDKRHIVGSNIVRKNGGKIIAIPTLQGHSTTNTIYRINK